ncbi:hypothetical protein [Bradyrhizobium sp. NC92]|uniref:hypothetical protein n=1 Tax=Bradyrhizobium sp. (strain NC92) TaxID=55395 RepID=UPI0021AAD135|nr:hypothetical protein [Bradyrhizobium sp. NC92]UWU67628.1 hypothetical protein N2602_30985 [Bradyrhizobium sp. NC92]
MRQSWPRVLFGSLGLAAALWAFVALPSFRAGAPILEMALRIVTDDRYKLGKLGDALLRTQPQFGPALLQAPLAEAEAIIRVRRFEEALALGDSDATDREAQHAQESLRISLFLNPSTSYLWLMLYSLENTRGGFDPKSLTFLTQSYATGPLEGWVALRRNRLALAVFPSLSEAVQEKAVFEFANMVDSDLTDAAAVNLMGVGWAQRDRLLASLSKAELISREVIARKLWREGVKIAVPGVESDERLWR